MVNFVVHERVQLLHDLYHPRNARSAKPRGEFTYFNFSDGATLKVKTHVLPALFSSKWKGELMAARSGEQWKYETPAGTIVARHLSAKEPGVETLEHLQQKGGGVEQPVAELRLPKIKKKYFAYANGVLLTRFMAGKSIENLKAYTVAKPTALQQLKMIHSTAEQLANIHAAGFIHGHPHAGNLLVGEDYSVQLIDPKELRAIASPTLEQVKRALRFQRAQNLTPFRLRPLYSRHAELAKSALVPVSAIAVLNDVVETVGALSSATPQFLSDQVDGEFQRRYFSAYEKALARRTKWERIKLSAKRAVAVVKRK